MPKLLFPTPTEWLDAVLDDFDVFLQDHAAAEKKAAGMALSMISHYPDKPELVEELSELAVEEMAHFREVIKWLHKRGTQLAPDTKDEYVLKLRKEIRQGRDLYFLDRLIIGAIIEARGHERFAMIADALDEDKESDLKKFYVAIARSEGKHLNQFIDLAKKYFDEQTVDQRTQELLKIEANIVKQLPIRSALH